jgi:ubiquinone/menaquinone biosynthesis C-methylase UbiE
VIVFDLLGTKEAKRMTIQRIGSTEGLKDVFGVKVLPVISLATFPLEARMNPLPREIQEHYLKTQESQRLSSNHGELERLRTQAILARELPPPPAVVFDIGGGAGVHAFWLSQQGHQAHLIDPVALHLEQAQSHAAASGLTLASIAPGDARSLDVASSIADAVLLLGPLYHLTDQLDRIQALREARRILKPGGILLAAAISRFASLIDGLSSGYFRDVAFREIVAGDLDSGQHRNSTNNPFYFTTAYFHRPEELAAELREGGFCEIRILAVEGPVWSASQFREAWGDPVQREKLMEYLSLIESEPSVQGASAHIIGVGRPGS